MNTPLTIETKVRFRARLGSRRRVAATAPEPAPPPPDPVPRIARLMALAIRFDRLIREGAGGNYAELARLGGVSRARITQIMNLLNLPPARPPPPPRAAPAALRQQIGGVISVGGCHDAGGTKGRRCDTVTNK
jgi:hypothetical protein